MLRVTMRGIRAHAVRFALSVLAVALGVAFVAGTFSLREMLAATFRGIVDASAPADAYLRGDRTVAAGSAPGQAGVGEQRSPVALGLADEVAQLPGVRLALPDLAGPIVLVGADGTAVQSTQAPSFGLAFDDRDPAAELLAGRAPTGDEVALEQATLESSGLRLGDRTRVVLGEDVREVEVVGEVGGTGPLAGATLVYLPVDLATAAYAPDGTVPTISVYGDGQSETALADELGDALADGRLPLGAGAEAVTGEAQRAGTQAQIDEILGFVTAFLLVFAVVALFVGAFLIANTFTMSVRQRVREFALLRAVGASPLQVFGVVVGQAVVVGLVGSVLGVLGGVGLVQVLRVVLGRLGMDLVGDVPLGAVTVTLCLVLGALVSAVAAAVPARRAALVPPVEAMRGDVGVPERSLRLRAVVGALAVLAGAAAVGYAAARPEASNAEPALGAGAALVLVGVLVVSPTLARGVLRVLAAPFVRLLPPMGRLARGNVVRNPRRTASTAGALVIGMALVGAVSVLAATAQGSLASVVESSTDADLVLRSASGAVPGGAVDAVRELPEVGRADAIAYTPGATSPAPGHGDEDVAGLVVGIGTGVLGGTLLVDELDGSVEALDDTHVLVNEQAAGEGWSVGDEVRISTAAGQRTATVGGVIDSQVMPGSVVVTPDVLDELAPGPAQSIDTVFVDAAPGVSLADLRTAVADAVAPYVVVSVQDQEEFVDQLSSQVDQLLVILYALLGLSLVIAVLGIVNTLALSVIERTREIGLLRAVGLGRLQLAGVVTVESVLTAVFGTLVGLAVGVGLASAMPRVYADEGLDRLVVPWGGLGVMVLLAILVGVLAAVWPGVRAARMRVLDAVATPD